MFAIALIMVDGAKAANDQSSLAASLPQLLSAIIGGVIALAVSMATNHSNSSRLRQQFALEREVSSVRDRRAKGEELFVLLHYWTSGATSHFLSVGMAMQGKLTLAQVTEFAIQQGKDFGSKYEAPRIELYIQAYFPACEALHLELLSLLRRLNAIEISFTHSYEEGNSNGTPYFTDYVSCQEEFERCHALLQRALINELSSI